MAPVLSKDVADISAAGDGTSCAQAGGGGERGWWVPRPLRPPPRPGKERETRKLCLRGRSADEEEEQQRSQRPACAWREKSGSLRLQGVLRVGTWLFTSESGSEVSWVAVTFEALEEFEEMDFTIRAFISQSIPHLLFLPCKRFGIPVCYPTSSR